MFFGVADFRDSSLRFMVDKWKIILHEQSQLEVIRLKQEQALDSQLVSKLLNYQTEFPLSFIQVSVTNQHHSLD